MNRETQEQGETREYGGKGEQREKKEQVHRGTGRIVIYILVMITIFFLGGGGVGNFGGEASTPQIP